MQNFDLESSVNCTKDSLKIYEGSVANGTLMSTKCGNDTTEYISQSSPITLLFSSDSTNAQTGYRINVTCMLSFINHYDFFLSSILCMSVAVIKGGKGAKCSRYHRVGKFSAKVTKPNAIHLIRTSLFCLSLDPIIC